MKMYNQNYSLPSLQKRSDDLLDILHCIPTNIYMVDMEAYEILFMNHHMQHLYKQDLTGRTCYESLYRGQKVPCRSCINHELINRDGNPGFPHIRERFHPEFEKWYEIQDRAILWDGRKNVRLSVARDITRQKQMIKELKEAKGDLEKQLKNRTKDLEEAKSALKIMIRNSETGTGQVEQRILNNFESLVVPFMNKLRDTLENDQQLNLFHTLELNMQQLFSSFSRNLASPFKKLTSKEIQVASMIRQGLTNKEIASALNNSIRTITSHRHNIREKLGLKNRKINLATYLASL